MRILIPVFLAVFTASSLPAVTDAVTEHDVLPILLRRCGNCHGATYQEGGLDLRSRASMLRGGDSGAAIQLGDADGSLLLQKMIKDEMPPEDSRGRAGIEVPADDEVERIRLWIEAGAPETPAETAEPKYGEEARRHWAYQAPRKPTLPDRPEGFSNANEIDAFLASRLEEAGLSFSPVADPLTLLRRASFALTGLPPTMEEWKRFEESASPQRYEEAVDRLLESPRYGEKWGRIWLDVAGYADSEGKRNADMIRPHAWRYRDYVIRSLNADKPYDQFLREQLAGDELVNYEGRETLSPELYDHLVATGFLRMAPDGTTANPVNRVEDRMEVISDELRILSEGVMGLTMECARCHDHKYDPISQRDYYAVWAIFKGAYDEHDWLTPQKFTNQWKKAQQRHLSLALPEEKAAWTEAVAEMDARIETMKQEMASLSGEDTKKRKTELGKEIKKLEGQKPVQPMIRALWDRGQPSNTYVLHRGDHLQPVGLVEPGVPEIFGRSLEVKPPWPGATQTGRRLAFARWLTQADHPLTARVIVNRVWQQHFGEGLVRSVDNFGVLGTKPSHPELLDWLAVSLVEQGWSLKWLHREIMTSRAYRQRSTVTEELSRLDPENELISRMPLRRLEAEEVRDSILAVSGRLDFTPFGEPDPVEVRDDGLVWAKYSEENGTMRRSIYVRHRRKEMPTILETFDQPAMNPNCVERTQSTIVTQPLYLLNNRMIHDLATSFAERVAREAGEEPEAQIRHAWILALNRKPAPGELIAAEEALEALSEEWRANLGEEHEDKDPIQLALADFCHTLINSAGFLYLD